MSCRPARPCLGAARPGRLGRLLAWLMVLAAQAAAPALATAAGAAAAAHRAADGQALWQAARLQAQGDAALQRAWAQSCASRAAPVGAMLAQQRLDDAERAYRAERTQPSPDADRLRRAVVLRNCAAHHAHLLQAGDRPPVWWFSTVALLEVRPGPVGLLVRAQARTARGPVVNSRITFSRGQHHACFASTDARGEVACTLVDTHPHAAQVVGWDSAHDGPLVATLAGNVAPGLVELPAVARRELPSFSTSAFLR